MSTKLIKAILGALILINLLSSCRFSHKEKDEQISARTTMEESERDTTLNSIKGNLSFNQINTSPNSVINTGLPDHRLVTVYKWKNKNGKDEGRSSYDQSMDYDGNEYLTREHFMPGFDILYGYYLINIAHYDMKSEKLNFLFDHPVLIKTLYYPSFVQDSLHKKPINRNFYLVSVYDQDTNKDTLLNRKDLRRFYLIDATANIKTQVIPADYSVERSEYDSENDAMYLFARYDADKNGSGEKNEPLHIFWISLKNPGSAKRLY